MAKTTTTNFALGKFADGDTNWGTTIDGNFDTIDAALTQAFGVSRPGGGLNLLPMTITFQVGSGVTGTNVSGIARAPRAGSVSECVLTVSKSDSSSALTFSLKRNGTAVVTGTVAAGAATNSTPAFTITPSPLSVAKGDLFTLDITAGSSNWAFTVQMD